MTTERLCIGGYLNFESNKYDTPAHNKACFEYVTDSWFSDTITSVTIDADTARKLIAALDQHFGFTAQSIADVCAFPEVCPDHAHLVYESQYKPQNV